jgi:hypothetical protein
VRSVEDTRKLDDSQEDNQTTDKPNTTTTNYFCSSAELLRLGSVLGSTKNIVNREVQEACICGNLK